jgi:tRNA (guanine-N7-)-methyltransferase
MPDAADQPRDPATSDEPPRFRREPVSFTRRGGRLTEKQQSAWDELASTYVLDVPRSGPSTSVDPEWRVDPRVTFGREAPLVVEIGSGRGENVVAAAQDRPDVDFLAVEVWVPGVAQTLVQMRATGVTNVRLAVANATELLGTALEPGSVHELWTWFPDPWHKKRHTKRRLVTVPFTELVARVLEPGGTWRMATDWADYAEQVAEVLAETPHLEGAAVERFDGRVLTKFEQKGLDKGRVIHDFAARVAPGGRPTLG